MRYLLNEMPVVRRRDIIDRLLKINPKEIDLVSQGLRPEEEPDSGPYNDNYIVNSFEKFKNRLDRDLPPSKYSKYEDVVYNWAINHGGHSYDDLIGAIIAFESEYENKLRAIDKTAQIFSTSLEKSLNLSDLYEMMSLIDEKQRYSRKDMTAKDDSKFNAIGIYPLHLDFSIGDNLSRFIMEFIEGDHQIMIVKPTNTSGSIFWAKANLFGNEQGVESAYQLYNDLEASGEIDEYNLCEMIQIEKNHSGTVNWCTSTGSVTGNMFLGYAAGSNRHLYYTFNPFKDLNDNTRRFCTGPLWGQGNSYIPLQNREDESHGSGGTYVDSKNRTFSLKEAIKEWNKYSSKPLENVNKNLSQNRNTECRQEAAKQTFEGFIEKCKTLPVMQSIIYKTTLASVYGNVKEDDDLLKNKNVYLLKKYLKAESMTINIGSGTNTESFRSLGSTINSMWRDFLKEKGILRLRNKIKTINTNYNAEDVLEGFANIIISVIVKAIFFELDKAAGLLENNRRTEDLLEIYNIIHKKNYKRKNFDDSDYEDLDNYVLELEDDYRYKDIKEDISINLNKEKERIEKLEEAVKSSFLFIESGFENQDKHEFVEKLSYFAEEFSEGYSKSLYKKIEGEENKTGYESAYKQGKINHAECVRKICSYSGLNFEETIKRCLVEKDVSHNLFVKISDEIGDGTWRDPTIANWDNELKMLYGIINTISMVCNKLIDLKDEFNESNELLNIIYDKVPSDKKLDLSEYYKLCLENIDYFLNSKSFINGIKDSLTEISEVYSDISIEVSSNNRYNPKQFISLNELYYNIEYEGIDEHVNLRMLTKTADIDFIASASKYLKNVVDFESNKINSKPASNLLEDLKDTKYSLVSSEDVKRNFNSFIDYIFDKKAFNKTYKQISKLTEPLEYTKDDMYWEVIFYYGQDIILKELPKIVSELGYLLQENIESRFSTTRFSYFDYDDPDATHVTHSLKVIDLDVLDMPLSKAAIEKAFENFFIENIDWDDQFINEGGSGLSRVIKQSYIIPEDLVAVMGRFYPWTIVK